MNTPRYFAGRLKADGQVTRSFELSEMLQKLEETIPIDLLYEQEVGPDGTIQLRPVGRVTLRVIPHGKDKPQEADEGREAPSEHALDNGSQGNGARAEQEANGAGDGSGFEEGEEAQRGAIKPKVRPVIKGSTAIFPPDNRPPPKNPGKYDFWPE